MLDQGQEMFFQITRDKSHRRAPLACLCSVKEAGANQ